MSQELRYVNSTGEAFDFMGDHAYFSECELRDWSWEYEAVAGKVTRLYRDMKKVTVPVTVTGGLDVRDRMADVFERDVAALTPGTLSLNGWERRCFVIDSQAVSRWVSPVHMQYNLVFLFVDAMWSKYAEFEFPIDRSQDSEWLNLPFDFPIDVGCGRLAKHFDFSSVRPCDFRLTVFGPARSPYVVVGGNTYQVNTDVPDGALLTVDSRERKILIRNNDGSEVNAFHYRAKGRKGSGSFVFEKVNPGFNEVSWDNTFPFLFGVYKERSEPSWS